MTKEQRQAIDCMGKDLILLEMLKSSYEQELTEEGDMPDAMLQHIADSYQQILERWHVYNTHIKQEVGRIRTLAKKDEFLTDEATEAFVQAEGNIPMHMAPGAEDTVDLPDKSSDSTE